MGLKISCLLRPFSFDSLAIFPLSFGRLLDILVALFFVGSESCVQRVDARSFIMMVMLFCSRGFYFALL